MTAISSCSLPSPASSSDYIGSSWKLIYRNDAEGVGISGSKDRLFDVVRLGYPVRVGYGGKRGDRSIEHVGDAMFLSILDDKEIFAQCQTIIGQRPGRGGDSLHMAFRENYLWTIIVGTNGYSDRINVLNDTGEISGHNSRPTAVSWFALIPSKVDTADLVDLLYQ